MPQPTFSTTIIGGTTLGHDTDSVGTNQFMKDLYHAKWDGVVADGVTDDSTALQNAVNNANGKVIILPVGTIKLNTPITLPMNFGGFIGAGVKLTIVKPVSIGFQVTLTSDMEWLSLAKLTIDGGTTAIYVTTSGAYGLYRYRFEELVITNVSEAAIWFDNCYILYGYMQQVFMRTGNYGLKMTGTRLKNQMVFMQCAFRETQEAGVLLDTDGTDAASSGLVFLNCVVESNFKLGMDLRRAWSIYIGAGCHFENNGRSGNGTSTIYPDIQITGDTTPDTLGSRYIILSDVVTSYEAIRTVQGDPYLFLKIVADTTNLVTIQSSRMHDMKLDLGNARLHYEGDDMPEIVNASSVSGHYQGQLLLSSPDGTLWKSSLSNSGVLTWVNV